MPTSPVFTILFAPEVLAHLGAIERKHHRLIQTSIHEQLQHSPLVATRNRKPLDPPAPFAATWELRFGSNNRFRVLYEVEEEERVIWILAIGVKAGNRLLIGEEEFGI